MAKKTLLQIVQDILNDMDADEVNSISDTVESVQVAQIVRSCYEEMMSNRNWPHQRKLVQLDSSGSTSYPNYLKLPEKLKEMVEFRYNKIKTGTTRASWARVSYMYPDEFLAFTGNRNSTLTNVQTINDYSGVPLLIMNDRAPSYWTSFDDVYLVTDAYDAAVDNTLQSSKSQVIAYLESDWQHQDSFIPDMPSEAFSALIEEAKSTAMFKLKQMADQKAEQKASRQNRWLSRKAWRAEGGVRYENFGRKGRR